MIYLHTEQNIQALLQAIGTMEEAQLIRFFSDELQPIRVQYLLNELTLNRVITHDKEHNTYSSLGAAGVIDEVMERRFLAFWVVASMGSNGVLQVLTTHYPIQYLVIKPNAVTYDFAVIENAMEARVASRVRAESQFPGVEDVVTHVAVLRRPSDVDKLRSVLIETGFDCCCTVDYQTKKVTYVDFGAK